MTTTAQQEVDSLDRVLTRLATTDEGNLEKVLSKLLPIVIAQLKSPHHQTKQKVLDILSHVNKRVRGHEQIKLPLGALLDLFLADTSAPLVKNFAVVYVEMAMDRSSVEQQVAAVPKLLLNISKQSSQHKPTLLRLSVIGLEAFSQSSFQQAASKEEDFAAKFTFLQSQSDREAFLIFATKVMLYQPAALLPRVVAPASQASAGVQALGQLLQTGLGSNPLARGGSGGALARGFSGGALPQPPAYPPGLAKLDVPLVEGKSAPTVPVVQKRKLGLLHFTSLAGMDPGAALLLYLIAAADPQDPVSRQGEELLRKRCGLDSPKPSVVPLL